jgi:hypothetical protein
MRTHKTLNPNPRYLQHVEEDENKRKEQEDELKKRKDHLRSIRDLMQPLDSI